MSKLNFSVKKAALAPEKLSPKISPSLYLRIIVFFFIPFRTSFSSNDLQSQKLLKFVYNRIKPIATRNENQ